MERDIDHVPAGGESVPHLRFLKWTVGGLAAAMVIGLAAIVAILWMRLNAPVLPQLPQTIELPAGAGTRAITFATDRVIVVTDADAVLIYDHNGQLIQQIALTPR